MHLRISLDFVVKKKGDGRLTHNSEACVYHILCVRHTRTSLLKYAGASTVVPASNTHTFIHFCWLNNKNSVTCYMSRPFLRASVVHVDAGAVCKPAAGSDRAKDLISTPSAFMVGILLPIKEMKPYTQMLPFFLRPPPPPFFEYSLIFASHVTGSGVKRKRTAVKSFIINHFPFGG